MTNITYNQILSNKHDNIQNLFNNIPTHPVLFIAHGSPMNAIADNFYTKTIAQYSSNLSKPKGIIVISAHWITLDTTFIQSSQQLRNIYDFSGFPQKLYDIQYKPPGDPSLSISIFELLQNVADINPVIQQNDNLDHGAWSILTHMFPNADIPVVQISIDFNLPHIKHLEIGMALSSLSTQGYLIIGSGNLIHNLRHADFNNLSNICSQEWAFKLSQDLTSKIYSNNFADINYLLNFNDIPFSNIGINIADHYIPFLYSLGAGLNYMPKPIYQGFELGTLDMHSIAWGAHN